MSLWIVRPKAIPSARMRLFCFFAGGPTYFNSWVEQLPAEVEVCAIQFPGRGKRLIEPLFTELKPLVQEIEKAILPLLDRPYAFFGHSMGSLISFELARSLRGRGIVQPTHLFLSAFQAPHLPKAKVRLHELPDRELVEELRQQGGAEQMFLDSPELTELFLPVARADLAVVETYEHEEQAPLEIPIVVLGGEDDPGIKADDLAQWSVHTSGPFQVHVLPGDHFFLYDRQPELLAILRTELTNALSQVK
jgi:medium-chain acyl-[acyl-carrier-protein] hydrolase